MINIKEQQLRDVVNGYIKAGAPAKPLVVVQSIDVVPDIETILKELFPATGSMYNTSRSIEEGGSQFIYMLNHGIKPTYVRYSGLMSNLEKSIKDSIEYSEKLPTVLYFTVNFINQESIRTIESFNLNVYIYQ